VQGDVAGLDPREIVREHLDGVRYREWRRAIDEGDLPAGMPAPALLTTGQALLLIASPPCQAFSMAGKGEGRRAIDAYLAAIAKIWERGWDAWKDGGVKDLDEASGDPRGHLVLEPLRWAMALTPDAIALEQVEPVLPVWEAIADVLRKMEYSVWTGIVSAEQYGVPQTRRRAILLASRVKQVSRPKATHQRWIPPRKRAVQEETLFEAPEPQRIVHPDDRELLPWVSMAEALGWVPDDQAGLPRRADNDNVLTVDGVDYRDRDLRPASEPAQTLTEKTRSWLRFRATNGRPNATERTEHEPAPALAFGHNAPVWLKAGTGEHEAIRAEDEPAPTLRFGQRLNTVEWLADPSNTQGGARPDGIARSVDDPSLTVTTRGDQLEWQGDATHYDSRGQRDTRSGEPVLARQRAIDEPAPTIAGQSRNDAWVSERPATIAGDTRVHPPGHKENSEDEPGKFEQRRGENAIRVSLAEALVLQSFPADYPVQGTKTKQFEQVGNAIPPLLALAALEAVLS
jgi:DNA (cytosine-5)-methyltransferase 1